MGFENIKRTLTMDKGQFVVEMIGHMKQAQVATKVKDKYNSFYHGYSACKAMFLNYLPENKHSMIAILDDYGLEMTYYLMSHGYDNIKILSTEQDNDIYKKIVYIINNVFKNTNICIMNIKEKISMKFDIIIANPPFELGNNITDYIINNIDFDTYVNLLPLSKYKSNKLYQHVVERCPHMSWWNMGLQDAKITWTAPELCILSKSTNDCNTYEEFEFKYIYNKKLLKFWNQQLIRKPSYLEHIYILDKRDFNRISSKTSFIVGIYTPQNYVNGIKAVKDEFDSGYTLDTYFHRDCWAITNKKIKNQGDPRRQYVWNFLRPNKKITDVYCTSKDDSGISEIVTIFRTEQEKINFTNWWYSAELSGRNPRAGLSSILLWGMNKPTGCPFPYAIPRVDWSRPWTDEEILFDYGYTEAEVDEILRINSVDRKDPHLD